MYDLSDPIVRENLIQIVESQENQERIDRHITDYQIVFGNQKRHIIEEIIRRYPESYQNMIPVDLQIGRKINRKLSRCYSSGVKREVVDKKSGVTNKKLTDLINYVYTDKDKSGRDFDMIMQKSNELYANHLYVEVFNYLDNENKIRFKALPQQLFTAIPDEHKVGSEVLIFKHNHASYTEYHKFIDHDLTVTEMEEEKTVEGIYTFWTKSQNMTVVRYKVTKKEKSKDETGVYFETIPVIRDSNLRNINPFNILPFTQIKQPTEGHFYPYGSEVPQLSKDINLIFSDIIHIAAQQGFGQAVLYYDGKTPPKLTKSGPTHMILIPNQGGNSKFEFANANPDLSGHLEVALAITRLLLTTNDLTTDKVSGELNATQFASAIDRLIADSETIENIEDQRKKYQIAEKNNFSVVMEMIKYLKSSGLYPEDYPKVNESELDSSKFELRVTFNNIKPLTTEKEKAETIVYLHEQGLILDYEKHMRFNQNLTPEQAKERQGMIQEEKKKNMEMWQTNIKGNENASEEDNKRQSEEPNQGTQGKVGRLGLPGRQRQEIDWKRDNREDQAKDKIWPGGNSKR